MILKNKHYFYTEEMIDNAYNLFIKGMSITKIASQFKIDRHQLSKRIKEKYPIKTKSTSKPKYDYNSNWALSIVNDYVESGLGTRTIVDKYKTNTNVVSNILKHHNVKITPIGGRRTNYVDETIFEKIDTEEKAYWLGFLYADGSLGLSREGATKWVELSLKKEDYTHLEKFKRFMKSEHPIQYKLIKSFNSNYEACKIAIYSKKIFSDLEKLGCTERKSLILKFPSENLVPKEFVHHFMRGYFDGDGHIGWNEKTYKINKKSQAKFSVLGTILFLETYEKLLADNTLINPKKVKPERSKAFNISHGGNKNIEKIFHFLYKDATIFLKRKHDIFIAVLSRNVRND